MREGVNARAAKVQAYAKGGVPRALFFAYGVIDGEASGLAKDTTNRQHGFMGLASGGGIGYNFIGTGNAASVGNVSWFVGHLETPAHPMSFAQSDLLSFFYTR